MKKQILIATLLSFLVVEAAHARFGGGARSSSSSSSRSYSSTRTVTPPKAYVAPPVFINSSSKDCDKKEAVKNKNCK